MRRSSVTIAVLTLLLIGMTYAYLNKADQYNDLASLTLLDDNDPKIIAALSYNHAKYRDDPATLRKFVYFQDLWLHRHPCVRFVPRPGVLGSYHIYCFDNDKSKKIIFVDDDG